MASRSLPLAPFHVPGSRFQVPRSGIPNSQNLEPRTKNLERGTGASGYERAFSSRLATSSAISRACS